jgi:catechol 2,3-dioxygenase-like lactoylglutathione lyase family enzyme
VSVSAILAFRFVTAAPDRLAAFYAGLGFQAGSPIAISADEMALLGLRGGGRRLPFRLGDQRLDLDCLDMGGAPYPGDIHGADTRFQHIALVTSDADASWRRARRLGATPISVGDPVTLPASSGSVTAFKFRDPEGHPLEFLQFPGAADGWAGQGLLGVDHTAIGVADLAQALRFYEAWGLTLNAPTLNNGPTQAALDGLRGAEVDVAPMNPPVARPHLELLAYRTPRPRHTAPCAVNDIAATRIVWAARETALTRDPDGHLHQFTQLKDDA